MASITIRKLDEQVKAKLKERPARRSRPMEEEVCGILKNATTPEQAQAPNLAQAIRRIIGPLGGVELQLPKR